MRRIFLAAAFVLLLALAFRREGITQPDLVREIAPGVFHRQAEPDKRIIANTSWIVFRDYVLVVDSNFPWGARAVLNDLRRTTDKPVRFVFNTHYHGDHSFGASVFVDAGATVVCSEECTAESLKKNPPNWEKSREQMTAGERLEHPQLSFRERLVLDDGTRRVELLKLGPGHTSGDAVAWLPKERVLFTGDLAVNWGSGNYMGDPDADHEGWVRALDRMMTLGAATVIPGHGFQGTGEALKGQRAYIRDMIDKVRAGIRRGATAEQLSTEIDLSAHNPWGQSQKSNQASIRAVHAKLSGK